MLEENNNQDQALVPVTSDGEIIVGESQEPLNDRIFGYRPSTVIMIGAIAVLIITLLVGFFANSAEANQNVVTEFPRVSERFNTPGFATVLQELKKLQPGERQAYLDKYFPKLHEDVVYYLRERGKLKATDKVASVKFLFGSASNVKAEDGTGKTNNGKFEDELIARVSIEGKDQPLDVIVQCLNGTFNLPGDLQEFNSRVPIQQFTIKAGEGLTTYVSMPTAVDLAKRFGLPMYRGKIIDRNYQISPEEAATINTDVTQVTVRVYPGDRFDLVNMQFYPAKTFGGAIP